MIKKTKNTYVITQNLMGYYYNMYTHTYFFRGDALVIYSIDLRQKNLIISFVLINSFYGHYSN